MSKINTTINAFTTIALTIIAWSVPTAAIAQEGSASAMLEEIVTVARKKSAAESVQDVPVAVNAFGAAQIDAMFVKKLDDLSYIMPNVQLEAVGTFPGVQKFSIRGQGINSSIPSVDPTVGVFVDGIYLGTTFGVVLDTFDIERLEVLRGPQGLLFGRNVTGGAVIIRNARPTGEFGTRMRVGMTDEDQYNIAAAIEGSLVEGKLAAKFVGYYDDDDGYFENVNQDYTPDTSRPPGAIFPYFPSPYPIQSFYIEPALRSDVGQMTTKFARPSITWNVTEDTELFVSVESGTMEGDGAIWSDVTGQRLGTPESIDEFQTSADELGFTDMKWTQATVELNVAQVGNGTLTNTYGRRIVDADSATDVDGMYFPLFSVPGFTDQDQWSNELRWSGSFSDTWESTLGVYYFSQDINYREGRYIQAAITRALGGDMESSNFGIFWNNEIQVSDTLTISAGLRFTDEKKEAQIISGVGGGCADVVTYVCSFDDLRGDWDNWTPKLGFQWRYNEASHLYGFYTKGYRSGGFNFRNAKPDVIPPGPTKEEENNTIEVGLKTDLMEGRMRLNVAVFRNEIDDIQRELNIGDPDVVVLQATVNAGDVTIEGVEVDFVALVMDNVSFNASIGVQDGEYDRIDPFIEQLETVLGSTVIGEDLPRLADLNYSAGFSWDIPTANAGLFNIAGNYSWRDENAYNDSNTEIFDEQERVNAAINWTAPDDVWSVSLYGRNLTDEANWGNLTSISGLYTAGPMQKGRVLGIEVNYRR